MSVRKPEDDRSEADGVLASRFVNGFGGINESALEKRRSLERQSTRTPGERARKAAAPRKPMTFKLAPETVAALRLHAGGDVTMTDIVERGIRLYVAQLGQSGGGKQ